MPNGRYACVSMSTCPTTRSPTLTALRSKRSCHHSCRDKSSCAHECCREGLRNPRRISRSRSGGTAGAGNESTAKGGGLHKNANKSRPASQAFLPNDHGREAVDIEVRPDGSFSKSGQPDQSQPDDRASKQRSTMTMEKTVPRALPLSNVASPNPSLLRPSGRPP